jgi:hypothetical protein
MGYSTTTILDSEAEVPRELSCIEMVTKIIRQLGFQYLYL